MSSHNSIIPLKFHLSRGTIVLENIGKMWKQGSDFASLYCVFLCMLVLAK